MKTRHGMSCDTARANQAILHEANRGFCGTIEIVDKRIWRTASKTLRERKGQCFAAKQRDFEARKRIFFERTQTLQQRKQRRNGKENIEMFLGDERDWIQQRAGRNHNKSCATKQGAEDVMHTQIESEVEKLRDSIAPCKAIENVDSRTIACEIGARDKDAFGNARAATCEE